MTTFAVPQLVSMQDLLDPLGFTLLRFDTSLPVTLLEEHAKKVGMPLKVVDVEKHASSPALFENAKRVYERPLLLVRPDQHVSWRSAIAPVDQKEAAYVIDVARGAVAKKPAPGIPILGSLFSFLILAPLRKLSASSFGRALAQIYFQASLVAVLTWKVSVVAKLRLIKLWLTV
jgi:hypothetical protein